MAGDLWAIYDVLEAATQLEIYFAFRMGWDYSIGFLPYGDRWRSKLFYN